MQTTTCAPAFLLILLLLPAAPAKAAIYRCEDGRGHIEYRDRGCPDGLLYQPKSIPSIEFAPLTQTEIRRLEVLGRRLVSAQKQQEAQRQAKRRNARLKQRQCQADKQAAKRALRTLRAKRRNGYSSSEAAALDAREADLKAELKKTC